MVFLFLSVMQKVFRSLRFGEILLHRAKRIEMEQRHLEEELNASAQGHGEHLTIGAGLVWAVEYFPAVINRIYDAYPQLKITLVSGSTLDLLQKMHCGELDIVFAGNTTQVDDNSDYQFTPLINIDFVVVVREKHPLATKNLVVPADLEDYSWAVLSQSCDAADNIKSFYHRHGLSPAAVGFESSYLETALSVVKNNDQLLLLPKRMYGVARQQGLKHLPLNEKIWEFTSGVWTDSTVNPQPAVETFIECMKDECASLHF